MQGILFGRPARTVSCFSGDSSSLQPRRCGTLRAVNTGNGRLCAALLLVLGALFHSTAPAQAALRPEQLILVVNQAVPESLRLARYYMEKRQVPRENMVLIQNSRGEEIGREAYERDLAAPIRNFITRYDPDGNRFSCLVLFYGVPLRIGPPRLSVMDEIRVQRLRLALAKLKEKEKAMKGKPGQETNALKGAIDRAEHEIARISRSREGAAVDSELSLVMESGHPVEGWLPNRFFIGFRGMDTATMPQRVMAVCRLDGPTEAAVYRIIDDSLFAEGHGLSGNAYFDARWPDTGGTDRSAYRAYDRAIHRTAQMVEKSGRMPVILDEREALFGPGEAQNAALYCGWYSLARYIDAFTWARGAVGFHVASAECTTLKTVTSTVWCKQMLEKGAAATLGPVAEPYLQSFPDPGVFFGSLLDGNTLVESYTIANPFWSWQMVLIGDPLYRPFKRRHKGRWPEVRLYRSPGA